MNIHKFFNGFKGENLRMGFSAVGRAITATWFSLTHHSMLKLWQTQANCLGTCTWRDSSSKTAILTALLPHCLHLWTTRMLWQKLWQDKVITVRSCVLNWGKLSDVSGFYRGLFSVENCWYSYCFFLLLMSLLIAHWICGRRTRRSVLLEVS